MGYPYYLGCYHNPTLNVYFELLLEAGGDVNQADNDNYTAPGKSSQNGHLQVVRLLLQQPNIDVNKGAEGWPPLALTRDVTLAILLLDNGGRPEDAHTNFQHAYRVYRAQLVVDQRLARVILARLKLPPQAQRMVLGLVGEYCAHCQKLLCGPSFATEPHLQICSKCHNERNPGFKVRHK